MGLSPKSVFITGGNRGIGLGLVKGFLALQTPPAHIFATCRSPDTAKDLQELAKGNSNLHIVPLDVTDYASLPSIVKSVEEKVGADGLNLLINNAGIMGLSQTSLTETTPELMRKDYEVNTIAPVMLVQHLLPLLKRGAAASKEADLSCSKAAIVNVSSRVGSVADNSSGGMYAYRASKSALNNATKSMSVDLASSGILAVVVHPGLVQTDLVGSHGKNGITVEQSVQGLLTLMTGLDQKKSGGFFHSNGQELPW